MGKTSLLLQTSFSLPKPFDSSYDCFSNHPKTDKPLLFHFLDQISSSKYLKQIVIITSANEKDDSIKKNIENYSNSNRSPFSIVCHRVPINHPFSLSSLKNLDPKKPTQNKQNQGIFEAQYLLKVFKEFNIKNGFVSIPELILLLDGYTLDKLFEKANQKTIFFPYGFLGYYFSFIQGSTLKSHINEIHSERNQNYFKKIKYAIDQISKKKMSEKQAILSFLNSKLETHQLSLMELRTKEKRADLHESHFSSWLSKSGCSIFPFFPLFKEPQFDTISKILSLKESNPISNNSLTNQLQKETFVSQINSIIANDNKNIQTTHLNISIKDTNKNSTLKILNDIFKNPELSILRSVLIEINDFDTDTIKDFKELLSMCQKKQIKTGVLLQTISPQIANLIKSLKSISFIILDFDEIKINDDNFLLEWIDHKIQRQNNNPLLLYIQKTLYPDNRITIRELFNQYECLLDGIILYPDQHNQNSQNTLDLRPLSIKTINGCKWTVGTAYVSSTNNNFYLCDKEPNLSNPSLQRIREMQGTQVTCDTCRFKQYPSGFGLKIPPPILPFKAVEQIFIPSKLYSMDELTVKSKLDKKILIEATQLYLRDNLILPQNLLQKIQILLISVKEFDLLFKIFSKQLSFNPLNVNITEQINSVEKCYS